MQWIRLIVGIVFIGIVGSALAGRALLTHPALGQDTTPSHTEGREEPSDQPPGPWNPSVLRSAQLLAKRHRPIFWHSSDTPLVVDADGQTTTPKWIALSVHEPFPTCWGQGVIEMKEFRIKVTENTVDLDAWLDYKFVAHNKSGHRKYELAVTAVFNIPFTVYTLVSGDIAHGETSVWEGRELFKQGLTGTKRGDFTLFFSDDFRAHVRFECIKLCPSDGRTPFSECR